MRLTLCMKANQFARLWCFKPRSALYTPDVGVIDSNSWNIKLNIHDTAALQSGKRLILFFGAVVFLAVATLLVLSHAMLLNDPDTWWHIKTGQDILSSFKLPEVDAYSHSFLGKPWIAKEWLSQVFFAFAYNAAGWNGVLALAVAAIAAAMVALYWELVRFVSPPLLVVATVLTALFSAPVFVARPHIFTFAIAIIFTSRLMQRSDEEKSPNFWLLLLVVLWANLHGSFTLSFAIAGFSFLNFFEKNRFKDLRLTAQWLLFLALCPVVALCNPYFLQPLLINYNFISGFQAMSLINEWQPLNVTTSPIVEFGLLASLAVFFVGGVRLSFAKTLFFIFILHLMLTHIRFVYVFFMLSPILACREISLFNQRFSLAKWLLKARDKVELDIAKYLPAIITSLTLACASLFWWSGPYSPPPNRKIEGALEYIKANQLSGPVLNSYDLGGPLILNNIKTFIDGRAEQLFLGKFLDNEVQSGKPGGDLALNGILQEYNIQWAVLLQTDMRKEFFLKLPKWKKTFSDDYTVIFQLN
jgi:hypothetical protein